MKKNIIILVILILLAISNIFFGVEYYLTSQQLQKISDTNKVNNDILDFNKLFITKVLGAQEEVSYEDRLLLEAAAVNTKNDEIISSWHEFLASQTEEDAQKNTLSLLNIFIDKLAY